jgi:hypothetical protein
MSQNRSASANHNLQLLVRLEPQADLDDPERERLALQLRSELIKLHIDSISAVGVRPAPPGSKGTDAVAWGEWLITLSASGGVITTVLATVQAWLGRHRDDHSMSIEIDGDKIQLSRATNRQQVDLVRAFLRRHGEG